MHNQRRLASGASRRARTRRAQRRTSCWARVDLGSQHNRGKRTNASRASCCRASSDERSLRATASLARQRANARVRVHRARATQHSTVSEHEVELKLTGKSIRSCKFLCSSHSASRAILARAPAGHCVQHESWYDTPTAQLGTQLVPLRVAGAAQEELRKPREQLGPQKTQL